MMRTEARIMGDDKFTYSYSPAVNDEVDRITAKYIPVKKKGGSDLEQLRKLDRRAELPGTMAGISVGLFGVLILCVGIGLVVSYEHLISGLIIGAAGLGIAAAATPVSRAAAKRSREKYRDEILALCEKIKSGN